MPTYPAIAVLGTRIEPLWQALVAATEATSAVAPPPGGKPSRAWVAAELSEEGCLDALNRTPGALPARHSPVPL